MLPRTLRRNETTSASFSYFVLEARRESNYEDQRNVYKLDQRSTAKSGAMIFRTERNTYNIFERKFLDHIIHIRILSYISCYLLHVAIFLTVFWYIDLYGIILQNSSRTR